MWHSFHFDTPAWESHNANTETKKIKPELEISDTLKTDDVCNTYLTASILKSVHVKWVVQSFSQQVIKNQPVQLIYVSLFPTKIISIDEFSKTLYVSTGSGLALSRI